MKLRSLTRTAMALALLVALQFVTRSLGQLVTGSCVNLVLCVTALFLGWKSGLTLALISPVLAWLLGIGPAFPALVPCIALGNAVFVLLLAFLKKPLYAVPVAAVAKFLTLWLVLVKLVAPLVVPAAKLSVIGASFTWPQLITALIGGTLGAVIASRLPKEKASDSAAADMQ